MGRGVVGIEAKGVAVVLGSLVQTALLPQNLPQFEAGRRQLRISLQGPSQMDLGLIQVPRLHLHQGQLKVGLRTGPLPLGQGQLEPVQPPRQMDRGTNLSQSPVNFPFRSGQRIRTVQHHLIGLGGVVFLEGRQQVPCRGAKLDEVIGHHHVDRVLGAALGHMAAHAITLPRLRMDRRRHLGVAIQAAFPDSAAPLPRRGERGGDRDRWCRSFFPGCG